MSMDVTSASLNSFEILPFSMTYFLSRACHLTSPAKVSAPVDTEPWMANALAAAIIANPVISFFISLP